MGNLDATCSYSKSTFSETNLSSNTNTLEYIWVAVCNGQLQKACASILSSLIGNDKNIIAVAKILDNTVLGEACLS